MTGACPLCEDASVGYRLSRTPYAEIWRHLEREWGARISDAVKAEHTPEAVVELRCCRGCELYYFHPAVAGSERFYLELSSSSPRYYNETKWEFEYARELLRPHHRVLDVACGGGGFLRAIAGSVREAIGIDTNPLSQGHAARCRVFRQSIEAFSGAHRDHFDVVSAFQVIEHLDAVMPFVRASYACVKPGGMLVLSVPHRDRRKPAGFGSLDHPPHHLSRWSESQLRWIAGLLAARVVAVANEPLGTAQTIDALRATELPALVPYRFRGRDTLFKVASRLLLSFPISRAWTRLAMPARLGMFGMSVVIVLQKPRSQCAA